MQTLGRESSGALRLADRGLLADELSVERVATSGLAIRKPPAAAEAGCIPLSASGAPDAVPLTQRAFVLRFPKLSAREVVARANEHGMTLTIQYVRDVREVEEAPPTSPALTAAARRASAERWLAKKEALVHALSPGMSYAQAAAKTRAAGFEVAPPIVPAAKRKRSARRKKGEPGEPV